MKWISYLTIACALTAYGQSPRYVIADQDTAGPGGSDMRSLMVFLQAPDVRLLGVTVVAGDGWRDEEVAHALRLLELMGRTDVKVYPGASVPLWRTPEWTKLAGQLYGKAHWLGIWRDGAPDDKPFDKLPPLREGAPTTKPAEENAAAFMVRMVRQYPHQVTIYGAGPLTNIALAIKLDPEFPKLAQELVIMGGSIRPQTDQPEWVNSPRHEFNFWWDPEASSIVLRAPWVRISQTTIDASIQARVYPEILNGILKSDSAAAEYIRRYVRLPVEEGPGMYAWDELAAIAWLDPSVIKSERLLYEDVNTERGPGYGDTLTWSEALKPSLPLNKAHIYMDVDVPKFQAQMIRLFSTPTPMARRPLILEPPTASVGAPQ
jgi:inosine-uridine nucleoside N-ribohydrolase